MISWVSRCGSMRTEFRSGKPELENIGICEKLNLLWEEIKAFEFTLQIAIGYCAPA